MYTLESSCLPPSSTQLPSSHRVLWGFGKPSFAPKASCLHSPGRTNHHGQLLSTLQDHPSLSFEVVPFFWGSVSFNHQPGIPLSSIFPPTPSHEGPLTTIPPSPPCPRACPTCLSSLEKAQSINNSGSVCLDYLLLLLLFLVLKKSCQVGAVFEHVCAAAHNKHPSLA